MLVLSIFHRYHPYQARWAGLTHCGGNRARTFAPSIFRRTRALNNVPATRQNFKTGTIPIKSANLPKNSGKLVKMEEEKKINKIYIKFILSRFFKIKIYSQKKILELLSRFLPKNCSDYCVFFRQLILYLYINIFILTYFKNNKIIFYIIIYYFGFYRNN